MSRQAHLEGCEISSMEQFHIALKEKLDFPDYYGGNLNALYDCLTGWIDASENHLDIAKARSF